jgi:hypothetical protein
MISWKFEKSAKNIEKDEIQESPQNQAFSRLSEK